jgi:hypothetical protein
MERTAAMIRGRGDFSRRLAPFQGAVMVFGTVTGGIASLNPRLMAGTSSRCDVRFAPEAAAAVINGAWAGEEGAGTDE